MRFGGFMISVAFSATVAENTQVVVVTEKEDVTFYVVMSAQEFLHNFIEKINRQHGECFSVVPKSLNAIAFKYQLSITVYTATPERIK